MQWCVRVGAWASTALIAAALLGCSVVDRYSSRAIVYNLEAEKAQEQAMLLNIVRASLGRPMQFTTVSTITGTATATGSAQYTFPVNVPLGPIANSSAIVFPPVVPNWVFGGSLSGGPAFTVPVLDTQEFYQGILTAIPGQIWDLYIQAGYPPDLLFNLFIEKVVMQRSGPDCPSGHAVAECEFVFSNNVTEDIQIDLFQALGDYLLALGLTTETTNAPTVPFDNPTSINVRFVGNPPSQGSHEAQVLGAPGGGSESLTASTNYDLCFAPLTPQAALLVDPSSLCGEKPEKQDGKKNDSEKPGSHQYGSNPLGGNKPDKRIKKSGAATVALRASDEFIDRLIGIAGTVDEGRYQSLLKNLNGFRHRSVNITIYMRHTEGMIYYLGKLVRREFTGGRGIFIKLDPPYTRHDTKEICVEANDGCAYIFHLYQGEAPAPADVVSVFYDGRWFSLPPGSTHDLSSLAFDFLKQQIALNSSAKSLPQSSTITTVGQ
jgi:hypothetical protein